MKVRKKPVIVDAFQWPSNENLPDWALDALRTGKIIQTLHPYKPNTSVLAVQTLEGTIYAQENDWIIKGVNDEIYPCKPDVFQKTYEMVE
jgi:hypothetical protein